MNTKTSNKNSNAWLALVSDVGGTNIRLALVDFQEKCHHSETLTVAEYPTIYDAISEYLTQVNAKCPPLVGIAVACPADQNKITFTNSHWEFYKDKLKQQLDCSELLVINDFAALAYSVPALSKESLHKIGGDKARANSNIAVLGPGTGFGVAGLNWFNNVWLPVAGEGGHIEWAALAPLEREVHAHLLQHYKRLSIERVMQGKGIIMLYKTICLLRHQPVIYSHIADIVENAINRKCNQCFSTLEMYCNMLGSVAGDMALLYGAQGGVYFGGGIVPRLINFINDTQLRERFESKGRLSDYNRSIPCFVITTTLSALEGMVTALKMYGLIKTKDQFC